MGAPSKNGRTTRQERRKKTEDRRLWDPTQTRKHLLNDERGTLFKEAPFRIGLCYPNPYHTGMSSLGFQVIYRLMNEHPGVAAERVFLPDNVELYRKRRWQPLSIERGRQLGDFDLLAFSVAYDLDIPGLFEVLSLGGVPCLREERTAHDPPVLVGGPITASNVLPLGPFIDLAIIGDGEVAMAQLLLTWLDSASHADFLEAAAHIPGVWVPEIHGNAVPPTQKVRGPHLPALGQIMTPHTELSNMFLVEGSRGCPRFCKFCLVRATESPMREANLRQVIDAIPSDAERVGFVGAAISEWSGIRPALREVVAMGKGVGISSLRADRLDQDFVDLLAQGSARTLTVAADAPSQRLRNKLAKGIRTPHLLNAAHFAKNAGMRKMKLYVIVGLPDETPEDLQELVDLVRDLSAILPVAVGVSPLVPKLHTPLGDAPFAGVQLLDKRLKRLKKSLGPFADMRSTSARWAWVEYRVSQGSQDAGLAAYRAWQNGGSYAAWKKALEHAEERGGLQAAQEAKLWPVAGMK